MIEKIIKPFLNPIKKRIIMPLKRLKNWPKLLQNGLNANLNKY